MTVLLLSTSTFFLSPYFSSLLHIFWNWLTIFWSSSKDQLWRSSPPSFAWRMYYWNCSGS